MSTVPYNKRMQMDHVAGYAVTVATDARRYVASIQNASGVRNGRKADVQCLIVSGG